MPVDHDPVDRGNYVIHRDPPATMHERSPASIAFESAIAQVRLHGCRCPLRFDGTDAVPLTPGDAKTCPYHQDR